MALRPFIPWPDKRLRTAAEPVAEITDDIRAIWTDMVDVMNAMPGYGLAAPQIGVMLRLAVVDCSQDRGRAIRLANPEIVSSSDETFRPARVTVTFTDEGGNRLRQDFEDLWATSVQHQIDHLNGKMYFDRLSRTKRQMLLKRAQKR